MTKPNETVGDNSLNAALAMARAFTSAADAFSGVAHARTASNVEARTASSVEGRTVSEADRRDTSTFSMPRRDSDVGTEEGWAQFLQEAARRDRVHFDNGQFDSRKLANDSAERVAMLHNESIKHLSNLSAQILDAQKLGTNNMWTASNELEFVVNAVTARVLADMAKK